MPRSRPTSSRPEWIELQPVQGHNTEQARKPDVTTKGITVRNPDSTAIKQGFHFPATLHQKPLHQRRVSLLTKVISFLNKFSQRLRGTEQPSKEALEQLQKAGSFFPSGITELSQDTPPLAVDRYLAQTHYSQHFNSLLTQIKKLDQKYNLLDKGSQLVTQTLLSPDATAQGTNLAILKEALQQHEITLQAKVSESVPEELEDIKLTLNESEMAAMKETRFFHAYQMYLILSGLITTVGMRKSDVMERDQDMASKEAKRLLQLSADLVQMITLTIGLCQAAMKEEMPELFRDDLYTALSLQDEKGYSHFRSDGVQPRGGWDDLV